MVTTLQQKIVNRLRSINELDDVTVDETGELGQVAISHRLHHAADFKFKWVDGNHFVGYFVDANGDESQAIVSLWSAMDAVKFIVLYSTLIELKAKR